MFEEKAIRIPVIGDTVQFKHRGKWVAAIVTRVEPDQSCCSLTIFPKGHQIMVVDRSYKGDGPGNWRWPKSLEVEN